MLAVSLSGNPSGRKGVWFMEGGVCQYSHFVSYNLQQLHVAFLLMYIGTSVVVFDSLGTCYLYSFLGSNYNLLGILLIYCGFGQQYEFLILKVDMPALQFPFQSDPAECVQRYIKVKPRCKQLLFHGTLSI